MNQQGVGQGEEHAGCRYLYVELEDAKFGERAAFVHGKLQAAPPAGQALDAIGRQMGFTGQLRSISVMLKVSGTQLASFCSAWLGQWWGRVCTVRQHAAADVEV